MDKQAVAHSKEGRTFIFRPLWKEQRVRKRAVGEVLDRVFGGNASDLVSHLLDNEKISPDELKRIRDLINEKAGES